MRWNEKDMESLGSIKKIGAEVLKSFDLDEDRILEEEGLISPDNKPLSLNESLTGRLWLRINAISYCIGQTCRRNQREIIETKDKFKEWMEEKEIVRFVGAGRALLAATMPGNRLAHGGAQVSFMGGTVPMPNSIYGGGIVSCSASGKTQTVLEAMKIAKKNNPDISIIGLALHDAHEFKKLCDIFIGIHAEGKETNPLSALADTEEYIITELLDGLVVAAGQDLGFNDESWRKGHEDIGPTGPYEPLTR